MLSCGLCGASFTEDEASACKKSCPVATGCGLVTCPSCGFEFPPESKLVSLVTNLFRKVRGDDPTKIVQRDLADPTKLAADK
ncbi:MAG: hypothetical protein KBF88_04785 [Polyangiaceae bacterium]|nr:hypothetical protein [Polyangiaceae bacterium]